jgi:hypothetical protein
VEYRDRNARYLNDLQNGRQKARADEKWQSWAWAPDAAELAALAGSYERKGALLPQAVVEFAEGALFMTSGGRRYRLTPAAPDLFGAQTFAYDEIDAVAFVRGPGGKIIALEWEGDRYKRLDPRGAGSTVTGK